MSAWCIIMSGIRTDRDLLSQKITLCAVSLRAGQTTRLNSTGLSEVSAAPGATTVWS